jgi:hypothetical protein
MSILEARPCGKRSGVNFQKFVNMIKKNPAKIDILLARALLNDEQLDRFDGQGGASECVFSYPNKDWFGVYLLDSAGNKVEWGEGYMKYYFKLKVNKMGSDAAVTEGTVDLPDDLKDADGNEIDHCVLRGTKCGDPDSMRVKPAPKGRTPKVVVTERDEPAPRVASQVSPVLLQKLEDLSLGSGKSSGKSSAKPSAQSSTITREFFEQMKTKEMIVEWMINNMDPKDLIKCVKKGSLSRGDLEEAEKLASSEISEYSEEYPEIGAGPSGTSGLTNADIEVLEMAKNIPESELTRMLKKVTKESISELINRISDETEKKKQLIFLCKRAGINKYSTQKSRGVLTLFEGDDLIDDEEIPGIVDECAAKEATKLRRKLLGSTFRTNIKLNKAQPVQPVQPVQQGLSVEQISRLPPDEQKLKIVELSGGEYYTKEVRGKLRLFDKEGQLQEKMIPGVIATLVNAMNSFGKRRRSLKRRKNNN